MESGVQVQIFGEGLWEDTETMFALMSEDSMMLMVSFGAQELPPSNEHSALGENMFCMTEGSARIGIF